MSGQRIGYVRVSSFDQNPERQLENVPLDRIFTDKVSGKDTIRPQLEVLFTFVRDHAKPGAKPHAGLASQGLASPDTTGGTCHVSHR